MHLEPDKCDGQDAAKKEMAVAEEPSQALFRFRVPIEELLREEDREGQSAQENQFGSQENAKETERDQGEILWPRDGSAD